MIDLNYLLIRQRSVDTSHVTNEKFIDALHACMHVWTEGGREGGKMYGSLIKLRASRSIAMDFASAIE